MALLLSQFREEGLDPIFNVNGMYEIGLEPRIAESAWPALQRGFPAAVRAYLVGFLLYTSTFLVHSLPASLCMELGNPLLHLCNLIINHRLHARIDSPVVRNQIRAMEAPGDDLQWRGRRAGKWPVGPKLRADAGAAPRIVLPVRPDQPRAVGDVPAMRIGVHARNGGASGAAVGVVAFRRKEEGALTLPV